MLRAIILRRIASFERRFEVPLDYLRFIVRASTRSFLRFTKLIAFAGNRKHLPHTAHHAVALVATVAEDCGPCVQFGVNAALEDGVDAGILRCVLEGDEDTFEDEGLRDAVKFARKVVANEGDMEALRERVRGHYGDAGLVEVAFAIAGARAFPTTKRALGFASACVVGDIDFGERVPDPLGKPETR